MYAECNEWRKASEKKKKRNGLGGMKVRSGEQDRLSGNAAFADVEKVEKRTSGDISMESGRK